jgi:uncharacterized protein (DUF58 family)
LKVDTSVFRSLARLRLHAGQAVRGRQQGERQARATGAGVEFADHRPYQEGDDLRRVDWNAWQRQPGQVLLRLFSEDRNMRVTALVDATGSMGTRATDDGRTKLDHAGTVAAGIALLCLSHRDFVRVGCYGGKQGAEAATGHDMGAMPGILELLGRTDVGRSCPDPRATLLALAGGRRADVSLLLSDMLAPEDEQEDTLRALATLGHQPVLLHVVSPDDLAPDLSRPQKLVDAETGEAVEIPGGPDVERAWREAVRVWLTDLDTRCRRLGIRRFLVRADQDAAALFRDDLRRAGLVTLGSRG